MVALPFSFLSFAQSFGFRQLGARLFRVQAVLGKNVLQLTQESFLMGECPLVGLDLVQGSALGPRARSLAGASSAKEPGSGIHAGIAENGSQCCAIFVLSGRHHHCRRVNPV